ESTDYKYHFGTLIPRSAKGKNMIIIVANIKGGMSRTTISVMLSRAFSQAGNQVALADATWFGESARRVRLMEKAHGLRMPFEVREFPKDRKSTRLNSS